MSLNHPASIPLNSLPWSQNRFRAPEGPSGFHCCCLMRQEVLLSPKEEGWEGNTQPAPLGGGPLAPPRRKAQQIRCLGPLPASPGPLSSLCHGASRERQLGEIGRRTSHLLWALGKHISGCFLLSSQSSRTDLSPSMGGTCRGPPAPNPLVAWPSRKSQKCTGHTVSAK